MQYSTMNIEKLLLWAVAFFTYLEANIAAWGVSATWVSEVKSKLADLQTAHDIWANPATKTKAAHADMEDKRRLFTKAIEPLVQNLRTLPMLTAEDYVLLQIAPPNTGHRPKKPRPETWLLLTFKVHGQGVVEFHYRDSGAAASSTAKPKEASEAVIRIGFTNDEPASAEDLKDMVITVTRTPQRLDLAEHIGEKLHASGAWVNPTGERGPWGPIASTVIA